MLSKNHTASSQNGQNKVNHWSTIKRTLLVLAAGALWLFFIAQTAMAADFSVQKTKRNIETYKVSMADLSDLEEPRLDWRNPKFDIPFKIPASDWIEDIDLFIKIHAEGRVNQNVPVFITFNNGEPTPIYAKGNSFQAKISLNTAEVKSHRNTISVNFGNQNDCIENHDGAFSIDMRDSFLVVKASTPTRNYYLRDAKQVLNSPLTTPKSVSIKAYGPQKLKYEGLAAQGIALNMPSLPRFTTGNNADSQIFIGTRQHLDGLLKGSELARRKGPLMGVIKNAPLRLVLTADNEEELDQLVKSFASKEMPAAQRSFAFAGEFSWQPSFSIKNAAVTGKKQLFELGKLRFDRGWGNSAQSVKFDVDNPLSASGTIKVDFQKSPSVSKDSTVNISLNGESLGTAKLTSKRNRVKINIPQGLLVGTENLLTINPELSPVGDKVSCASRNAPSGFSVSSNSYVEIRSDQTAFTGDLTRFAASGFPFSSQSGQNTAIILATSTNTDKSAALRAFAHLGKIYGSGWVDAEFYSLATLPDTRAKNTLFIGPKFDRQAPRALTATIDGRRNEPKVVQTASLSPSAISLLSMRTTVKGGILAVFNDDNSQHLKAYLTTSRGHNFSRAVDQIIAPNHWNQLQGSMARWNKSKVEMAKTAFKSERVAQASDAKKMVQSEGGFANLSLPSISLSDISLPETNFKPVENRLSRAARETGSFFGDSWRGLKIAIGKVIPEKRTPVILPPTKPAADPVQIPAPVSVNTSPKPMFKPRLKPVVAKPAEKIIRTPKPVMKPAPEPAIAAPAIAATPTPKPRPFVTTTDQLGLTTVATPKPIQYDPGASLRGLSRVKPKAATTKDVHVTPQYKPISERETAGKSETSMFGNVSGWMSQKLDGLMGNSRSQPNKRQANLLVFAVAIILLLLLLALAKPRID